MPKGATETIVEECVTNNLGKGEFRTYWIHLKQCNKKNSKRNIEKVVK